MYSRSRSWRISALLAVVALLVTAVVPALALQPAPGAFGPVPVTEADLAREPQAVPAGAQPVAGPASLRNPGRTIQAGVSLEIQALAALGDAQASVSVQLDGASLASVSKGMTAEQRVAYAAEIKAAQDKIIAEVEAAGGKVLGRFTTLASGFTASMAGREAARLASRPGVARVSRVRDYQVDLSETVPWIGGAQLQSMGLTGKGVDVAVLDTGVDFTHLAFGGPGTVDAWEMAFFGADPLCTNGQQAACANTKLADPALFGPTAPKVKGGYDWVGDSWISGKVEMPDPNPIPADNTGGRDGTHGSHVADIIAGLAYPAGDGYAAKGAGMAPGANLWSFKVCSSITTSCSGIAMLNSLDDAADLDNNPATYDPADVLNMSIGSPYGQPEDDTTFLTNQAVAYGMIVVISAGNSGDKPYIVGSPSIADGAISVAQTTVPSAKEFVLNVVQPPAIAGVLKAPVFQPWSVPLSVSGAVSGTLQYGNADGSNKNGCAAYTDDLTGKIILMDRGVCSFSIKGANASAAHAVMGIIGLIAPGDAFEGSYGGGTVTIPNFMITQAQSNRLKSGLTAGVIISAGPDLFIGLADSMVGSSSRGPSWSGVIKPDIGAPGASISAVSGSGVGSGAFGGTSGAAPMVAGAAALLKGFFGDQFIPQEYRALLMNSANTNVYMDGAVAAGGGGTLAPITRIGAGQVNVAKSYKTRIMAWDSTDANPLKWTGSLSFGYQPVTNTYEATRILTVKNLHPLPVGVWFSSSFRFGDDQGKGVTVATALPGGNTGVFLASGATVDVPVRLTMDASKLRAWGLNKGSLGASGTALTTQEYDGYIKIETCTGGKTSCTGEFITVPWQVLPKKAADASVKGGDAASVTLTNAAPVAASNTDVFALVDQSPNDYNYTVGSCGPFGPGCNLTPVDLKEVGVRDFSLDGSGTPDSYAVEFGITIWDKPYRSSQIPVEFDVYVDADRDGVDDYVVYNYDQAGSISSADGRSWVTVYNLKTNKGAAYFYTDSDFNTQNWILTVPAAAIGVAPGQQFDFYVLAYDAYFQGTLWDISPRVGVHTFTVGTPRFNVGEANIWPTIDPLANLTLPFTTSDAAKLASPSQTGLLFMHREAPIGRESSVFIPPAAPVEPVCATAASKTLAAAADTYLAVGAPTSNYGTTAAMYIGGNDTLRGLVGFDLAGLGTTCAVDKATLRLYVQAFSGAGTAGELRAYDVTKAWGEKTATWNSPWTVLGGDYVEPAAASLAVSGASAGKWVEFDVTTLAKRWATDAASNAGVILRLRNAADYSVYQLDSRSYWFPQYQPQLVVDYRTP